jgi:hypothetical protein
MVMELAITPPSLRLPNCPLNVVVRDASFPALTLKVEEEVVTAVM